MADVGKAVFSAIEARMTVAMGYMPTARGRLKASVCPECSKMRTEDAATAKSELLVWTGATPGSPSAAAEPVAQTLQTLAAESPAAIKAQVQDLQSTFVQLEKYDTVTDPNTLLQEGPLTTGHVTPDSNALGTYVNAHC